MHPLKQCLNTFKNKVSLSIHPTDAAPRRSMGFLDRFDKLKATDIKTGYIFLLCWKQQAIKAKTLIYLYTFFHTKHWPNKRTKH
jgi:hypothetical protein